MRRPRLAAIFFCSITRFSCEVKDLASLCMGLAFAENAIEAISCKPFPTCALVPTLEMVPSEIET